METMKKTMTGALALLLLLSGCTKQTGDSLPDEMHFVPERAGVTRVTDAGFEIGDAVGVYVTRYDGQQRQPLQLGGNYASNPKSRPPSRATARSSGKTVSSTYMPIIRGRR